MCHNRALLSFFCHCIIYLFFSFLILAFPVSTLSFTRPLPPAGWCRCVSTVYQLYQRDEGLQKKGCAIPTELIPSFCFGALFRILSLPRARWLSNVLSEPCTSFFEKCAYSVANIHPSFSSSRSFARLLHPQCRCCLSLHGKRYI